MVLPEDEVVLLEVSSVVAEDAVTALDVTTEAVVAAGATELEADVELGFCLAGHAATVTAETAMSMVWNFILSRKIGAESGQMRMIGVGFGLETSNVCATKRRKREWKRLSGKQSKRATKHLVLAMRRCE